MIARIIAAGLCRRVHGRLRGGLDHRNGDAMKTQPTREELMAAIQALTKKVESLPDVPDPINGRTSIAAAERPLQQWARDPEQADTLCEVRRAIRRALDRGAISDEEVENVSSTPTSCVSPKVPKTD